MADEHQHGNGKGELNDAESPRTERGAGGRAKAASDASDDSAREAATTSQTAQATNPIGQAAATNTPRPVATPLPP